MNLWKKLRLDSLIYHMVVLSLGFLSFYPVLWLIASSLKPSDEIFQKAYSLIPSSIHFENYLQGWRGFGGVTFGTFFKNSLFIASLSTIGQLIACSLAGFGFARLKFVGKNIWFAIMIITLLLPGQVLLIPRYLLFNKLGWIDTYRPLILPHFFAEAFFTFLMVQFIRGIPKELDEAAKIDGCSPWGIFYYVILPNLKPPLTTAAIFSFYWTWNNFMDPLLYIQTVSKYPVSLALQLFSDPSSVTNWGAMFSMAVLSLVPAFIIFIAFQRYLVEGISTTGLRG
jgi:multiple sugar transport system permease protein